MIIQPYTPIFTPGESVRFEGYVVDWVDNPASYKDATAHDPITYTATPHRFPAGIHVNCTLHYDDSFNGQPVIIDNVNNIAYGLAVL